MYTRGRDRELAALGELVGGANDPKARLINLIHDWIDGSCSVETVNASVPAFVEESPSDSTCNLAFYWVNGLIAADRRFLSLFISLCGSRRSLVRMHAAFNFQFSLDEPLYSAFRALLGDRSQKVRQQIASKAEMGRWFAAVPALRERSPNEPNPAIRAQIEEAAELIEEGFRLDPTTRGRCWVYSGDRPGGAGAVSWVSLSDYPIEIIRHVSKVERSYLRKKGAYPQRPKGYVFRPNMLLEWDPNGRQP